MIRKIQKTFALSEKGAGDLVRAVLWTIAANLSLMLPVALLVNVLMHLTEAIQKGRNPAAGIWGYTAIGVFLSALIYLVHHFQYGSLYVATYTESAQRRVTLGEKLRELPLSFFGRRDLSDLTATLMADCSSLELFAERYAPLRTFRVSCNVQAAVLEVVYQIDEC